MPNLAIRRRAFQWALIIGCSIETGALTTAQPPRQSGVTGTFAVRGRVMFSDDLPAVNMDVSLGTDGQSWPIGPVTSGADGFFRIDHLPAGRYFVLAYSAAQGGHIWDRTPAINGSFQASTITVGPETPVGDVTFRIERRAKVYGTIKGPNGDPVSSVAVYALRRVWAFGRPYLENARQGGSDDTGNFRLWDLPKGRYRFCAVCNRTLPPTGNADFNTPGLQRVEVADCPFEGPFVDLRPGEERRIDLGTHAVAAVPVRVLTNGKPTGASVRVLTSDTLASGTVEFLPKYGANETRSLFGAPNLAANQYRNGIVPYYPIPVGKYKVRTTSYQQTVSGTLQISVTANGPNVFELPFGADPVVNLDVTVPPGYDKSAARIGLHDGNDPGAFVIDSNTQLTQGAPTNQSVITVHYPGRYWLVTRSELCPSSATAGNINLLTQPLTLMAGQSVTLRAKFQKTCAVVSGQVKSGANPAPGARVAILISGSPQDPGDVLVYSADERGEFKFTGLAAGSYWLWAWRQDDEESGYIDSLGEVAGQGLMVHLAVGETKGVELHLLQIARRPAK
jgi:hypothetical protein